MRVVVLGAGYAGLLVARSLEDALPTDVELVLVEEYGAHLIQHELHRVVRRPGFADDIVVSLDDLFDRAVVRQARVERVDPEARTVELADGGAIDYDVAAVCLGAETDFAGVPGVEANATPLKRLRDARRIRTDFLALLDDGDATDPRTVVVGGAGLSGIQVAGELAELAREEDAADHVRVLLVEQLDAVAPGFREDFQTAVHRELEARSVSVRTGATIERATADEIRFVGDDAVRYDQFVWTGGIRGTDALGGERPAVKSTLALDDRTFVVGDAGRVVDAEGTAVPASAQAATREAKTAARNVCRVVESEREGDPFSPRLDRFVFDSRGWLVSVGDGAVAQVGPSVFTGPAARALKVGVGTGYLAGAGAIRDALDLMREEYRGDAETR